MVIATDDERIKDAVIAFGGKVIMTSKNHPTGTDRLVEVAKKLDSDFYVNVQSDEPFIRPDDIDQAIDILQKNQVFDISTLCYPISEEEAINPNNVKVVFSRSGKAKYFSRSPIPYIRDKSLVQQYKHIGLYVFRKIALHSFPNLRKSNYEEAEKLEQLRFLESDIEIGIGITTKTGPSIDSPEDIRKAENYYRFLKKNI